MSLTLVGIDSGFATVGAVRWLDGRFVAGGTWRSAKSEESSMRSNILRAREMERFLSEFVSGAKAICVEAVSLPRNASTSHKLGIGLGILCTVTQAPILDLSPQMVRRLLGLSKGATKRDVQDCVLRLHPELEELAPPQKTLREHFYDAAAVLLAWLRTEQGRFLVGQ